MTTEGRDMSRLLTDDDETVLDEIERSKANFVPSQEQIDRLYAQRTRSRAKIAAKVRARKRPPTLPKFSFDT